MRLVDLTRTLDAADMERLPEAARLAASVLVPRVEHITPEGSGADIMCALFGCSREDLPDGEGWGDEDIHLSSHIGTLFLAELGAKVLGTDAVGWDRPFMEMRRAFEETADRTQIWDGHFAGRDREVFIVQQLDNLAALPSSGFKVGFFPMKLARCSAAPARVVAFLP